MMLDAKTIEDVYMSWHMIQQRCSTSDYETAFAKVLDEQIAKLSPRMVEQLGVIGMTVHSRAVVKQLDMLVECLGPDQDDFIGIIKDIGKKHAPAAASRDIDSVGGSSNSDNDLLTSRSCLLMGEAIIRTVAFFLKSEDVNTTTATAIAAGNNNNNTNSSPSRSWAQTQKAWNELLSLVFSVMRKEVRRYEKKQRQKKESKQQHETSGHDEGEDGEVDKKKKRTKKKTATASTRSSSSRRPQSSRMLLQTSSAHTPRGGRKPRSSRCLDVICLDDNDDDDNNNENHHRGHDDSESTTSDELDDVKSPSRPRPGMPRKNTLGGSTPKGQSRSMRNLFSASLGTPLSSKPRSSRRLLGRVDESESSSANLTSPTKTPGTPHRRRDQAVFCADSPSGSTTSTTECTSPSGSMSMSTSMSSSNHKKNAPKSAVTTRQQKMMNMSMNKTNGGSRRNVFALASPGLFRKSPKRTQSDMVHATKTRKGRQELLNAAKIDL